MVTFEYSGSAPHAAIVFPLKADFTANRTATKEAAGPKSLKRLEQNKGGRERGGGGGGGGGKNTKRRGRRWKTKRKKKDEGSVPHSSQASPKLMDCEILGCYYYITRSTFCVYICVCVCVCVCACVCSRFTKSNPE